MNEREQAEHQYRARVAEVAAFRGMLDIVCPHCGELQVVRMTERRSFREPHSDMWPTAIDDGVCPESDVFQCFDCKRWIRLIECVGTVRWRAMQDREPDWARPQVEERSVLDWFRR